MAQELAPAAASGRRRVVEAAASGVAVAIVAAWFVPWQLTVLISWDVAALFVILRVWARVGGFDAETTRRFATREDDTRAGAELLLVIAGSASLAGVAAAFIEASDSSSAMEVLLRGAGILTIVLSWGVIHTMYALRYARLFYTEPVGGIDFKTKTEFPDYRDFAYVAFTVGMTYQVSDTDVTAHEIRRTVLRHALLSFLFGAVILATTINVIASLFND